MSKKIFYLTGFMGSGKSTIGPILANTIGWDYYDLDDLIEADEGMQVSKIFELKGEEYFRKIESKTLEKLSEKEEAVISLGGGTVTINENLELINKNGWLIYLRISPEAAYERLKFKRDRPILTRDGTVNLNKQDFVKKLSALMERRKSNYEKADIIFDTDNASIGFTVDKLAKLILKKVKTIN